MKNFWTIPEELSLMRSLWVGIAVAIVITVVGTAILPRTAWATTHDPPEISTVHCDCEGIVLQWRTGNNGQVEAPEGWKVERKYRDSQGTEVVRTFTFVGDEADALLTERGDHWIWADTGVGRHVEYTYLVRAINADGSDVAGATWSEEVRVDRFADSLDQPGIATPTCEDDQLVILWRTENGGQAAAPEGWKLERTGQNANGFREQLIIIFSRTGADALLTSDGRFWRWVDPNIVRNVRYTYRVRAVKADGSDVPGRDWSRNASSACLDGPLAQPGISVPTGQDNGISMFWHARNSSQDEAPGGWKVERRHLGPEGWVVKTFTFAGKQAEALQTHNEEYWDWVDTTAEWGVDYTYRVKAIHSDGSDIEGRVWSRRAAVEW